MSRRAVVACVSLLAISLSASQSFADDAADLIKSKNLTPVGNLYVLPAEKEVSDGVRKLIVLKTKVDADTAKRTDLENKVTQCKTALERADLQRRMLFEQYERITDIEQKNNKAAAIEILDSQIKEAIGIKTDLETKIAALSNENRDTFINMVIDLGTKVDKAQADYKAFAADADVKNALATVNQTSKLKMRLGPTTEFAGKVAFLQRYRKAVASDVISITIEGNVATVDVTFNGTLTRSMVLDTGASLVCLPADLAEQLKIVPGPADPTLHMTLADGRVVEAKLMILKSVRVGQFIAKDVECAVMPKTLAAAVPLLGGSFLQNFIVKIDPQAKELHLAAIEDSAKKITSIAGTTTKPAKTP